MLFAAVILAAGAAAISVKRNKFQTRHVFTGLKKHMVKNTSLYRSCAALASFSGTFDLILFQALNIEFIVEKVWFGVVLIDGLNRQNKWFLICFD